MRILIMGGTLHWCLPDSTAGGTGHEVVLFNRGNRPAPVEGVLQIKGDRTDVAGIKEKLSQEHF